MRTTDNASGLQKNYGNSKKYFHIFYLDEFKGFSKYAIKQYTFKNPHCFPIIRDRKEDIYPCRSIVKTQKYIREPIVHSAAILLNVVLLKIDPTTDVFQEVFRILVYIVLEF